MTCLLYCLMEPRRGLSLLSQPSFVLCWAESCLDPTHTLGLLWFAAPQRLWGNLFKQRGFFFLPTSYPTGSAHWDWKPSLLEGSRKQTCSRVRHCLCLSQVLGAGRDRDTSQKTPSGRWETASCGFALWFVGRMEEWELRILFLLCPWNRAPSLLPSCSCGLTLRTGSNTP